MPDTKPFERLPANVCPKNYEVTLQPNLSKSTFEGSVCITIEIKKATRVIELNCLELTLGEVSLSVDDQTFKPSDVTQNSSKETLCITFEESLRVGSAVLKIAFEGTLNDKLRGFYRSKYMVGTEERYAGVTQFESTDARRCFPCWDEPAIKATFEVTLIAPKNRVALSNMNEISNETHPSDSSLKIVKFAKTPLMSTYLLAVVIGEFDFIEKIVPSGVTIRVYTPMGKKAQGLFALDVAAKVLSYFEKYFQIDYPLPKLDLIAISDFSCGAMENWGLITYRETLLLVDSNDTSASRKQYIAVVVAHEIAHQWFGNLVTMEWWTHLWLNEGYATFGECLCISHLFPEYDIWTQFLPDTFIHALELDALKNSHPIEVPVGHPSEVEEIFDAISYCKGASVIRMLHNYIGEENFRKGMNIYLDRHRYENTTTQDLWVALGESSGMPVANIMSAWTEKTGFPMISVSSLQDGNNRVLTFSQQRFLANGSIDQDMTEWIVPVSILCSTNKGKSTSQKECLLESKSCQTVLEGVSSDDWVKINVNAVGFYRTMYPSEMLAQLQTAVTSNNLSPLDRLEILDDLFAMVQAGHNSTVDVLRFLKSFEDETNYTVWAAIHNILSQLNQLLSHTDFQPLYKTFVKKLLAKIHTKLGWDAKPNESHLDTLLRSLVLRRLGTFGEESVVAEAKQRLAAHLSGTVLLAADLRSAVYETVLSEACETSFQQMIDLYRRTEFHEEKCRIANSLGATDDPNLIQKVLQFGMSDEVRSQDSVFVIISVAHSNAGRAAAWAFFKANYAKLDERYQGGSLMARLIKCTLVNFASEEMAREVEDFFLSVKIPGTERTVQQSIECIRVNAAWLKRDSEDIRKFLSDGV